MIGRIVLLLLSVGAQAPTQDVSGTQARLAVAVELVDSKWEKPFQAYVSAAEKQITAFFGAPFRHAVVVVLCPSRSAFNEVLGKQWGMPKSEKWMVGAAGSEKAFFLSPRVWKTEASEHDPEDTKEIAMLVTHELTHSFHCQRNPSKELEGLDPMAWYVEGLATYVSGQEATRHRGQAGKALVNGRFPSRLEDVWTGQARYGLAGSLTRYVDLKFGRKKIGELLAATTNVQAMKMLGSSEQDLMAGWKEWVRKGEPAGK